MAKILVADDNSNVQKTVALALAELGVEVVSVNNGEAAVRKLAESRPTWSWPTFSCPCETGTKSANTSRRIRASRTCPWCCWWERLIRWMNAKRSASAPMEF